MMKQLLSLLCAVLFLCAAKAQVPASVEARIDSMSLLVGEQTDITLKVTCARACRALLPAIKPEQELTHNIEVIRVSAPDTAYLNQGQTIELIQRYTITAWDSALYTLPPFEVVVDTQHLFSPELALKVFSLEVDTAHVDHFCAPNEHRALPFAYDDWKESINWSLFIIPLIAIGLLLLLLAASGKPFMRLVRRKRKLPPHQVAMSEIARIQGERKWAEEDSKEYYTELTDTLRTYISDRYGFSATEMTTDEIIERLIQESDEVQLAELRELFRTADLVKFAKWNTLVNENDANLMTAIEYINRTKQEEDPQAKPEPEVVVQVDKERRNEVVASRIIGSLCACAALGLAIWLITIIVDLLVK